jgi:hypothetical protein
MQTGSRPVRGLRYGKYSTYNGSVTPVGHAYCYRICERHVPGYLLRLASSLKNPSSGLADEAEWQSIENVGLFQAASTQLRPEDVNVVYSLVPNTNTP